VIVFIWGLGGLPRGFGWIVALVFALATGLRLARFNTMIDVEKPKWQSEYFTGMPAPAGAITVLLPLYLDGLGLFDVRTWPWLIALYTAAMAACWCRPSLPSRASCWASGSRGSTCCRHSSASPRWWRCSSPTLTAR
jgi:CDP-diacylglycerol--serine O-phosphatidyltransferase